MNRNWRRGCTAAAFALFAIGTAQAQIDDGVGGNFSTGIFISVAERDNTNAVVRNLVIDTGVQALDVSDGVTTSWSTTAAQETAILAFISGATGTVSFNVGGALTDQSFATDVQGFMASGSGPGPGAGDFASLGSGITNIQTFIGDANNGVFSSAGTLLAAGASDSGWHNVAWGNNVGGALSGPTEILFGQGSLLQQWRYNANSFEIDPKTLGNLSSNLGTGDITFTLIPVPAAVWLFGSALGLLGWARRRVIA